MKATCRNGRTNSSGRVFNANHNTKEETRKQQDHIDHDLTEQNKIWVRDMNDLDGHKMIPYHGSLDAKEYEEKFYQERYGAAREKKNQRYEASRHREKIKTIHDIYTAPRTAPMESLLQIGRNTDQIDSDSLEKVTMEYADWLREKYGSNLDILDIALHVDEATPHIHARFVLYTRDKDGNRDVNQSGAFRDLKIERPDREHDTSRYNHPLITFSEQNRQQFYDICERHGYTIDRVVENPSKKHLELLEYKAKKEKEKLQQIELEAKKAKEQEQEAKEKKEKFEKIAETVKEEAISRANGIVNQANIAAQQITQRAEQDSQKRAGEIITQATQTAQTLVTSAQEEARESKAAAAQAQGEKEQALREQAAAEQQTAYYRAESDRMLREIDDLQKQKQEQAEKARKELEKVEQECDQLQKEHDKIAQGIEDMRKMGYSQKQLYKLQQAIDAVKKKAAKEGRHWFQDDIIKIRTEEAMKLAAQASRQGALDDYAEEIQKQEKKVEQEKRRLGNLEDVLNKKANEIKQREMALQEPEAVIRQRIQKEVDRQLQVQMPYLKNKADLCDKYAQERDNFRAEVEEYYAIASNLEVGQGVTLQRVIDAVHESRTQNVVKTVVQAANYLRTGLGNISQELSQMIDRMKQSIHQHWHRGR